MPEPEPITPDASVPTGVTNTYPVAVGQAVTGVGTATMAVLSGFGIINWTPEQWGLVLALVTAVIAAVYAFVSGKVYSPATVAKIEVKHKEEVAVALATQPPGAPPAAPAPEPVGLTADEQLQEIIRQIQIAPPPAPAPPVLAPPPAAAPLGLLDPNAVGGRDPLAEHHV